MTECFVPPKFVCWNPTLQNDVLGGGDFGMYLGLDELSWVGLFPLQGSQKGLLSLSAVHYVTIQEVNSVQPRRGLLSELSHAGMLILDF